VDAIKDLFKSMFTGKDNITYDLGRVLWAVAFVVGIVLSIFGFVYSRQFDLVNYGLGVSGLLVAGGAALKLKETTEPTKNDPPQSSS
jgi:hypothetical protein